MVTVPKVVRIGGSSFERPLVFELDPHYFAADPITVLIVLEGRTIHVELAELDQAVKQLHKLAGQEQ